MNITTFTFWLFVVGFLFVYGVVRNHRSRLIVLILGSLMFYAAGSFAHLGLLLGLGLMVFLLTDQIQKSRSKRQRKLLLITCIAVNVAVLCLFKYSGFFLSIVNDVSGLVGSSFSVSTTALALALPLGISFFTFHNIAHCIDVYNGQYRRKVGPLGFFGGLFFFPKIVSGPITRPADILPQLDQASQIRWEVVQHGMLLVGLGLLKKTLADMLAPVVVSIFDAAHPLSALEAWTGTLAFTAQLYADFSGYTDIALGLGLLIGLKLPKNFNLPYISRSPVEFWSRWHITLSTWIRDYLYMPVATSGRRSHPVLGLVVAMSLGGLWHGANWTFIVWGLYHGVLLAGSHGVSALWRRGHGTSKPGSLLQLGQMAITLYLVMIGFVLFRAPGLEAGGSLILAMHGIRAASSLWTYHGTMMLVLAACAVVAPHVADHLAFRFEDKPAHPLLHWGLVTACVLATIVIPTQGATFIYASF
jgi:D-alanyl-lipoteichoic acid acyltransferase DltB (MBOAT superfamily)